MTVYLIPLVLALVAYGRAWGDALRDGREQQIDRMCDAGGTEKLPTGSVVVSLLHDRGNTGPC